MPVEWEESSRMCQIVTPRKLLVTFKRINSYTCKRNSAKTGIILSTVSMLGLLDKGS